MNAALSPDDRRRLVGVLERLASEHDGERAAAGLLATRILRSRGFVWDQLVARSPAAVTALPARPRAWRDVASSCRSTSGLLTPREAEFLTSLTRWSGDLTPRQAAWLDRIAAKVQAATGAP